MLARYIGVFGNPENQTNSTAAPSGESLVSKQAEKIAMTAPVLMQVGPLFLSSRLSPLFLSRSRLSSLI